MFNKNQFIIYNFLKMKNQKLFAAINKNVEK